jgi:hypothetical protein
MAPNRRAQEHERAERKAEADARQVISKAERAASRRARKRTSLVRDAVLAIAFAFILFGGWKLISLIARVVAFP